MIIATQTNVDQLVIFLFVILTDRICLPERLLLPLARQGEPRFLRGRQLQGEAGHLLAAGPRLELQ